MPGGLLTLVSYGNQNVFLNGNPSKTFFKCTYAKYTNFGLQKFRIDFGGQRTMRMSESSVFNFKVPRYADLLMDTYVVVTMPNIWSPVMPPGCTASPDSGYHTWQPYDFKWIKNLGAQMVERVRFTVGGQVIQDFTGQYLYNMVERDFDAAKKDLFYRMTGNVAELNDPANANGRVNTYPSAMIGTSASAQEAGPEPSIRARKLYIPLNIWFTLAAKMAFPLVGIQYAELHIEVTLRPVQDLYIVRNVQGEGGYYMRPDLTDWQYSFYRFLNPPPDVMLQQNSYTDRRTNWAADVHLISTYAFLSDEEVRIFAEKEQRYLVREVYQQRFDNVVGNRRVDLKSLGMVVNWMWFFQRTDAYLRNEWSNYTNWPYGYLPYNVLDPSGVVETFDCSGLGSFTPATDLSGGATGIMYAGQYQPGNHRDIMERWALMLDGKYRENDMDAGVLEFVEKYVRTNGDAPDGLYCYNFCLDTNPFVYQPSGAMNMSKFNQIEFEFKTHQPVLDASAQFYTICGPQGQAIGANKLNWNIYDYTYNLFVFEERYNILEVASGTAGLMFAR
ncbi:MAG: major capsid protein [Candidatus Thorarchaeota archaeon]|jgi:hypothetical protein